jgi:hypothetical protein
MTLLSVGGIRSLVALDCRVYSHLSIDMTLFGS